MERIPLGGVGSWVGTPLEGASELNAWVSGQRLLIVVRFSLPLFEFLDVVWAQLRTVDVERDLRDLAVEGEGRLVVVVVDPGFSVRLATVSAFALIGLLPPSSSLHQCGMRPHQSRTTGAMPESALLHWIESTLVAHARHFPSRAVEGKP